MKHQHHTNHTSTPKRKWWQWVAVGLMLLAIGMYVLSLDDSVVPEVKVSPGGAPAEAGAAPGDNLAPAVLPPSPGAGPSPDGAY